MNKKLLSQPTVLAVVVSSLLSGCNSNQSKDIESNITMSPNLVSIEHTTPLGYQWVMIDNMSDEFSTDSLDNTKWRDHITTWKGRPPAQFLPENVSVGDGYLALKTSTHPKPNEEFSMAGASVSGKHAATYGFFEAKVKTSKVKMSTTFWLHSDKNQNRHLPCEKQFAIEIDILEMIGGWPERFWTDVMHSNTHYKPHEMKEGRCQTAPYLSKGKKFDTEQHMGDDFHTYAAWWVNPNKVKFYFDGQLTGTVDLAHDINPLAFNTDMSLRMVVETYTWQQKLAKPGVKPYPTDEELNNPQINTAYYDYVRSYQLIPSTENLLHNGDFENVTDSRWHYSGEGAFVSTLADHIYTHDHGLYVGQNEIVQQVVSLNQAGQYQVAGYAKNLNSAQGAKVLVIDEQGAVLAEKTIDHEKYQAFSFEFNATENSKVAVVIKSQSAGVTVLDTLAVTAIPVRGAN